MLRYTQIDSKVGFWPRQLGSKFLVFTRALLFSNGRSLQTQKLAPHPCQKPTFEPICVFTFLLAVIPLSAELHKEECPSGKRHHRTAIRHIESGGIGYQQGYTTLEAFFAADPSHWKFTPFLDARGHVFDNGKWAANAGIGLRTLWADRAYGINAYYDYRNTERFHSNQVSMGLETLGARWDFRINGYLPIGAKTSSAYHTDFGAFSGHY